MRRSSQRTASRLSASIGLRGEPSEGVGRAPARDGGGAGPRKAVRPPAPHVRERGRKMDPAKVQPGGAQPPPSSPARRLAGHVLKEGSRLGHRVADLGEDRRPVPRCAAAVARFEQVSPHRAGEGRLHRQPLPWGRRAAPGAETSASPTRVTITAGSGWRDLTQRLSSIGGRDLTPLPHRVGCASEDRDHLRPAPWEHLRRGRPSRRIGQATLLEEIGGADRVVLLGDTVEMRDLPLGTALEATRPFFEELGDAVAGAGC